MEVWGKLQEDRLVLEVQGRLVWEKVKLWGLYTSTMRSMTKKIEGERTW